jgi:uncharacterized protein
MAKTVILFATILFWFSHGQCQTKVIDMHIHSYTSSDFGEREQATDFYGNKGSLNADIHLKETFAAFKKNGVVKAVVSGNPQSVEKWSKADDNNIVIKGMLMYSADDYDMDSVKFEQMVKEKKIEIFGEIAPYYVGKTLSDASWQPFLRICEKYDIPVAIHCAGGDPGGTYSWAPKARLAVSDPFLIEDILVKYPKLRIYLMHSGESYYENALRLMAYYPQLYSDLGVLLWVEPMDQRYAVLFLKAAKESGYLHKVMFGSDQMTWPHAIEKSIKFLNSLTFLTKQDRENILYNNAANFLKLK